MQNASHVISSQVECPSTDTTYYRLINQEKRSKTKQARKEKQKSRQPPTREKEKEKYNIRKKERVGGGICCFVVHLKKLTVTKI